MSCVQPLDETDCEAEGCRGDGHRNIEVRQVVCRVDEIDCGTEGRNIVVRQIVCPRERDCCMPRGVRGAQTQFDSSEHFAGVSPGQCGMSIQNCGFYNQTSGPGPEKL